MNNIYISSSSLKSIVSVQMYKEPKAQSNWYKVLCRQESLYIDQELNLDINDPIYVFSQSHPNVEINSQTNCSVDSLISSDKNGIYILDVQQSKAVEISSKHGVICQSDSSLDDILFTEGDYEPVKRGELIEGGWSKLLKYAKTLPSNSLLVVDRNLFSHDEFDTTKTNKNGAEYKYTNTDGLKNIQGILSALLPSNDYEGEYSILILTVDDDKYKKNNNSPKKIYEQINKRIKKMDRDYTIKLSIVVIDAKTFGKDKKSLLFIDTHNRRVVSNYFYVYADQNLLVFNEDGKCNDMQVIESYPLFCKGLKTGGPTPQKHIVDMLTEIGSSFRATIKNKSKGVTLVQNGMEVDLSSLETTNTLLQDFLK